MSSAVLTGTRTGLDAALESAHEAVDDALSVALTMDDRDALLGSYRTMERLRRRLDAVEHRMIAEIERRGVPHELGATSTAALLRELLLIGKGDAWARVRAAEAAAARTTLTGEHVAAPFAHVAAAQAAGAISSAHAKVVVTAVDALPDEVQAEHGESIEAELVGLATEFDPNGLAKLATRIAMHHDPDGVLADVAYRERHRELNLMQRADGSGRIGGEVTAELCERLAGLFDALAAPAPEVDGVKDPRTAGQRCHDALLTGIEMVERAGSLPSVSGVSTTVVVHMSDKAWRTGQGTAVTGHGAIVPAAEAIRWGGGDQRVLAVALDSVRAVTAYGSTHRIFSERQRLAMAARDVGCTFPGCTAPAPRCQTHHLIDHADGGPTSIDNGALVCAANHREQIRQGWICRMIDHRPAWIPPPTIDPERRPRFNSAHHPAVVRPD